MPEIDPADPGFWVKTSWTREELEGKSVAFELTDPKISVSGTGIFRVSQRPSGELRIEIVVTTAPSYWQRTDHIFTLRQRHADQIQKHPNEETAAFKLPA
jgi:hypothetical protein